MKKFFAAIIALMILTTATAFALALYDTPYIGNAHTLRFHHRNCGSVNKMNPENQRPLNSVDEALAAGYWPCGNCKPCPPPPGRTPPPKGDFYD